MFWERCHEVNRLNGQNKVIVSQELLIVHFSSIEHLHKCTFSTDLSTIIPFYRVVFSRANKFCVSFFFVFLSRKHKLSIQYTCEVRSVPATNPTQSMFCASCTMGALKTTAFPLYLPCVPLQGQCPK